MHERRAVTRQVAGRYRKATKKEKGEILDEFVALTDYTRTYAAYVLRHGVASRERRRKQGKGSRKSSGRGTTYDIRVQKKLKTVWAIMDFICGKRLAPVMGETVTKLIKHGELKVDTETAGKLSRISAATIDRLLAPERKKQALRGRHGTKPGTLLKHQIPIRTFAEWDEDRPGFTEIDLVGHDGGNPRGEYCQTLDVTDIRTGWTETEGVRNKAQTWVFAALKNIRWRLPFDLLGIDSDNGSEFINHHLLRYCRNQKITFTRGRAYRKNDNCYVEQKNWSVVRRAVGYCRYDTPEELELLNELYGHLRLYTNFFQPVMKLIEKTRVNGKVRKRYDTARTPYTRVLESDLVPKKNKQRLKTMYEQLNPAAIKRQITTLQNKLLDLAALKTEAAKQRALKDTKARQKQQHFEKILGEATIHHLE